MTATAGSEPVSSELIDATRLEAWLDQAALETGQPLGIEPLAGGASNVMYVLRRGTSRWVLRRPAAVAVERANDGMRREYRLLRALTGTDVPHANTVALCDDHDVLGCTFFLVDHVEGVAPFPPPPAMDDDLHRAEIAFAMVDALARLHDVDWRGAGLHDFGHPDGFHERQVRRWSSQLASYDGRSLTGVEDVTNWLKRHQPGGYEPSITHGDYHMLNALIAPDPPGRVTAIVDWETATIGDPLLDLAGFCEIWCSAATDGWPSRAELVARYVAHRHLDQIPDLRYYEILYNFRLAVLLEGVYQRSLDDPTRPDQHGLGERALTNLSRAIELSRGGCLTDIASEPREHLKAP